MYLWKRPWLSKSGERQGRMKEEREITLSQIKSQSVISPSNCLQPLLNAAKNNVCIRIYFVIRRSARLAALVCGDQMPGMQTRSGGTNGRRIAAFAAERQFAICHSAQQI